jgi:cytochrome c553
MKARLVTLVTTAFLLGSLTAIAAPIDALLSANASSGTEPFEVARGKALWQQDYPAKDRHRRSCTSCHTDASRHHAESPIQPLVPSVDADRLTVRREIENGSNPTANGPWAASARPSRKAIC